MKSGLKEVVSQSVLADAKSTNEIGRKRGDISSINFVKTLILWKKGRCDCFEKESNCIFKFDLFVLMHGGVCPKQ